MNANPVELSVVIPAFNERHRLPATLKALRAHLDGLPVGGAWELIVVDDGSTDGTGSLIRAEARAEPRIRALHSPANHGKGHAVRTGVRASRGRLVLFTDADLATPVEELDKLLNEVNAGFGAAIGSRTGATRRHPLRELPARIGGALIRATLVPGLADTQCGFKLFDGHRARAAFEMSRIDGWGFDVEILCLFARFGWPVTEVPVRWSHQPGSKFRYRDYATILAELVRIRRLHGAVVRTDARGLLVLLGYLLAAVAVLGRLWADPEHRYLVDGGQDQNQWEWFFAVTARAVTHLDDPLFTTLQNHPDGVNLMANTVMLGLSIPLTPVTLIFGPSVTWAVVLTLGLAGTAAAWYGLIRRHLSGTRTAAAAGGAFCGFAPPMISHANAHPNFVVLLVIPLLIGRLLRLAERDRDRVLRDGTMLGLLIAYQIYLGEEALLLTATGLTVFAAAYALARPDVAHAKAGRLARGLGVSALVCLPLVAYPLTWQFFGPQSYDGLIHGPWGNDVAAITGFARQSLAGHQATPGPLDASPTEQNAFFGWPLAVLVVALLTWLRRSAVVVALGAVIGVAVLLSLGREITVYGTPTGVPGPWALMARLPLFESVVESRLAMVAVPAIGVLLAIGIDRAQGLAPDRRLRLACCLVLVQALLPITPKPLAAAERPATPPFFTAGLWKRYVEPGRSVVPVPPPDAADATALHWQVDAGLGFPITEGYFVGPFGPKRTGVYGAPQRPTSILLRRARDDDAVPAIGDDERRAAVTDLAFWRADLVVLGPHPRQNVLRQTLDGLFGPGRFEGGVWLWDVRDMRKARS
ncbi:glycosyltransferase family 2 protein [Actinomadura barringtoniae]|uniref:dolichyl-phosphate beta-glucosyltransferase n=1 Tax=Actinomadura barringtoniae TaxID=1427535 RepID=A0A939P7Z8_9ACTN|nr:dolichyl-phosphate beta-glucosyltransferase [Actinomadura barringtoniae]MBO2447567.1 glycosyltransferase family 2 protein [Actinomadura barringtoniae]